MERTIRILSFLTELVGTTPELESPANVFRPFWMCHLCNGTVSLDKLQLNTEFDPHFPRYFRPCATPKLRLENPHRYTGPSVIMQTDVRSNFHVSVFSRNLCLWYFD